MSNYYYDEAEVFNNGTTITGNSLSTRSNSNASSALSVAEANNNLFKYIPARNLNSAKRLQFLENTGRNMLNEERRNFNAIKTRAKKMRNTLRILDDPVRMAQLRAASVPETPEPAIDPIQRLRAEERRKRKEANATPKSGFLSKVKGLFTRKGGRRGRRTYRRRR